MFAFANAVAAAMNTIGFCSSLNDLLKENGLKIIDGGNNDIRIVGIIAILVMIVICAVGMEWESKVGIGLAASRPRGPFIVAGPGWAGSKDVMAAARRPCRDHTSLLTWAGPRVRGPAGREGWTRDHATHRA